MLEDYISNIFECDCCHDEFPMLQLEWSWFGQLLCIKCRKK